MRKKLMILAVCLAIITPGLAACDAGGSLTASAAISPSFTSSPAATAQSAATPAPASSPSPSAKPSPTPIPAPTPAPDGITAGEGFAVPEGDGLPIGEHVLEHGGYIYFCDGDALWRVDGKLKGKTKALKANSAIRQFFFDSKDILYYTAEAADGTHELSLYRCRDGQSERLAQGFSKVLRADGECAYLVQSQGGGTQALCCDLAGGAARVWLDMGAVQEFYFRGGLLYYLDASGRLIARDMASGQSSKVFANPVETYYSVGDWALNFVKAGSQAYFEAYRYSDRSMRKIPLDSAILRAFPSDALFSVLGFDGKTLYLCFNGYEEAASFYRVDAATGKAVKRLKADQCSVMCVSGSLCYTFTGTYTDGGTPRNLNVWACDMAGGKKTLMKRLSAKTGMVEELAIAGGYVWGFGSTGKSIGGGSDTVYLAKYLFALPVK